MNLFRRYRTLDEILPDFLSDVSKQIDRRSFQGYLGKTQVFSEWLASQSLSNLPLRKISEINMESFFNYLTEERKGASKDSNGNYIIGLDQPTCQKYKYVLHKLWEYAEKRGEVDTMPFGLITMPRKGKDMSSDAIAPEHLNLLASEIAKKDSQLYLAFMTEFYCFLRPGRELRLLKVGDVDLEHGTIQVITDHAKTKHKRIVTMPTQLIEIYKEQKIVENPKEFYVFGNKHKPGLEPCSVNMLRWRFNKVRDELNLPKGYKFYSGKHTGMTLLHNSNTVSMHDLMSQAGHSKLSSTQHYIKKHGGVVNTKIRDSFPNPFAQQTI